VHGAPRGEKFLIHSEKIALPDFHAVMAQNAVSGRGMKVKIRKGELTQELLALLASWSCWGRREN
jgi:hypothetical protein